MVTRNYRALALALFLVSAAGLTVACQKVPLLATPGSSITLTSSATALPVNGTADIIAQVIRASGSPPHEGTHITFTTTLGTIQPSEVDTDVNGRAVVKYVASGGSGTAAITASSGGVTVAAANAIKIAVGAAAVGGISANASPQTLPSSGGTTTITATVVDTGGNVLPGVPVTFSIEPGSANTSGAGSLSATVVTTDATGHAATQLTTNRSTTVDATAGVGTPASGSGATATAATTPQTAKVVVNVNATTTFTVTAAPTTLSIGQAVTITTKADTTASPIVRTTVAWGDGVVSTFTGLPITASHVYNTPGSFVIIATGTDGFGDTSAATAAVTVTPRAALTVAVAPANTTTTANTPVVFTATVTQGTGTGATTPSIQSVVWDFEDGTQDTSNSLTVAHRFNNPRNYVVKCTVTDTNGNVGTGFAVVTVN